MYPKKSAKNSRRMAKHSGKTVNAGHLLLVVLILAKEMHAKAMQILARAKPTPAKVKQILAKVKQILAKVKQILAKVKQILAKVKQILAKVKLPKKLPKTVAKLQNKAAVQTAVEPNPSKGFTMMAELHGL
ncbi:MAG: hypothetical protein R3A11_01145 [Bdellovibrionota bacterium]